MHDQALEQKLRAALRTEGDDLPLTITAAELERRLALRRRGGLGRPAGLLVAATVGIGLLGLAAVAGGWLEQRPALVPLPSPSLANPGPSTAAVSGSPAPLTGGSVPLRSLDDLLAPLDPATIVRAQSVGPADGPSSQTRRVDLGPWTVDFAAATGARVDRVWMACRGTVQLEILVTGPGSAAPREDIPIACDGSLTTRQVGLEVGDIIGLKSASPVSWRFIDEAQDRPIPAATAIPGEIAVHPGDDTLIDATSVGNGPGPDVNPSTGLATWSLDGILNRDVYRVVVACDGPRPLRYRIGGIDPPPGSPDDNVVTEVACDGVAHQDELRLTPHTGGTDVFVIADPLDAWRIRITTDPPPIALAPDDATWKDQFGFGPNLESDGTVVDVSLPAESPEIRVVVTCSAPGPAEITIAVGKVVDRATVDCSIPGGGHVAKVYPKANTQVHVTIDPHGAEIWTAIAVQARSGGH